MNEQDLKTLMEIATLAENATKENFELDDLPTYMGIISRLSCELLNRNI